jgi:hypothetical protein
MPGTIKTPVAIEKSSYVVNVAFEDENGNSCVPIYANWTLTDMDGTIINSRNAVGISNNELANNISIALSGNDLALSNNNAVRSEKRIFTIRGNYSSTYGTLPFTDQVIFTVQPLKSIS